MANTKIKATAQLFLDTSSATKDAKQFVADIKTQLASIEAAADKMTIFKEMVGYIGQVDKALAALKNKNSDAFQHMFDGLDVTLRKQLEDIFGISGENLGKFDVLQDKLNTLTPKSGIAELRKFAQEINTIYASVGMDAPIDIDGDFTNVKASQKHIEILTNACNNFGMVWQDVNAKIKGGFGFDGQQLSQVANGIVQNLEDSTKKVELGFNELIKIVKQKVKEVYDAQVDGASVKKLDSVKKPLYDALSLTPDDQDFYDIESVFDSLEDDGDEEKAIKAITAIIEKKHKVQNEISNAISNSNAEAAKQAKGEGMALSVEQDTEEAVKAIEDGKQRIFNALQKKVKEYYALQQKLDHERLSQDEKDQIYDQQAEMDKYFFSLGGNKKAISDTLTDLQFGDIDDTEALKELCTILGVEIPAAANEVDAASAKMQEFMKIAGMYKQMEYISAADVTNGIKLLEELKIELLDLADQGKLTSQDLNSINDAFDAAEVHLNNMNHEDYSGLSYGNYAYTYASELAQAEAENEKLKQQIDALQSQQHAETTDVSDIKEIDIIIDELDESSRDSAQSITGDMAKIESKTQDVTASFQELVNYISQSGMSPGAFFDSLESGAKSVDTELQGILQSLNLIDSNGKINLESIKAGYTNKGGFVSDQYTMIARPEHYLGKIQSLQPLLADAQKAGAQIGAIVNIIKDASNGLIYEVQNTVAGEAAFSHHKNSVNPDVLGATDSQLKDFVNTLQILQQKGLYIDWGGDNVLYDKEQGFSVIDMGTKGDKPFTVSGANTLQENLDRFTKEMFKFAPADMQSKLQTLVVDRLYEFASDAMPDGQIKNPHATQSVNKTAATHITNETDAHQQNASAINAENKALQAQIELKKKAQSMKWEEFALDESTLGLKQAAGIASLSQMEKFWKDANYEKEIDWHEITKNQAMEIFEKKLPAGLAEQWYISENFAAKDRLENEILADNELRNAALNYLYHICQEAMPDAFGDSKVKSFDEFLNTEFTLYRGDKAPLIYGEESKLSFSFDKHKAQGFEHGYIGTAKIMPKNTIGNAGSSFGSEVETFVPSNQTSWFQETNETFEEFYNKQAQSMQQEIDSGIVQLEKKRIQDIFVGSGLTKLAHSAGYTPSFRDNVLPLFQQGMVPDSLEYDASVDGNDAYNKFVTSYNGLPELQKKLIAYYSSLESLEKTLPAPLSTKSKNSVGEDARLFNAILNDPSGMRQHLIKMTGEQQFNLFDGQGSAVAAHKETTQAIKEEIEATKELKATHDDLQDSADIYDGYSKEVHGYVSAYNNHSQEAKQALDDFALTYQKYEEASSQIGSESMVADLGQELAEKGNKLSEVMSERFLLMQEDDQSGFAKYLKEHAAKLQKEMAKVEADVIQDTENIQSHENNYSRGDYVDPNASSSTVKDFEDEYKNQSQEAKQAIDDLALYYKELEALVEKINGAMISFSSGSDTPTLNEIEVVKDTLEQFKAKQQEIASLSLIADTDEDKQKIQELQTEAMILQNMLRSIEISGASSDVYQGVYSLSSADADELQKAMSFDDVYPIVDNAYADLMKKIEKVEGITTDKFQAIRDDDKTGAFRQYLHKKADDLQGEMLSPSMDVDNIAASEQQLQVEQAITAEKQKQLSIESNEAGISDSAQMEASAIGGLSTQIDSVKQSVEGKTLAFQEEASVVDQVVNQEIASLNRLQVVLDEIKNSMGVIFSGDASQFDNINLSSDNVNGEVGSTVAQSIQSTLEQILSVLQGFTGIESDNKNSVKYKEPVVDNVVTSNDSYQLLASKLSNDLATESTLTAVKNAIEQLGQSLNDKDDKKNNTKQKSDEQGNLIKLVSALTSASDALKDVASGIVQNQNVQKQNTVSAMSKILDPEQNKQITSIASSAVGDLGSEVQIKSLKALSDGVVKVEGAFKNAQNEWEGFTVKVNESNTAVDLAIDKQSAFAKALNNTATVQKSVEEPVKKTVDKEVKKSVDSQNKSLGDKFKTLDFNIETKDLSDEQQKIADEYKELNAILNSYSSNSSQVSQDELANTFQRVAALQQEIKAYKEKYNIVNGNGGAKAIYGTTATINAQAKFNTLKSRAQPYMDQGSTVVGGSLAQYEASLNKLLALQGQFKSGQELSPEQMTQFTQLKNECNAYAAALKKVLDASDKLMSSDVSEVRVVGDDTSLNTFNDRAAALQSYVQETYGASASIGKLNADATQLTFTIDNGDKTITNMTASLNAARTAIVSTTGPTEKSTSAFGKFFDAVKSKGQSLAQYFTAMLGIQEVMQAFRQGIQYVREIDSALTELKKVTDETDSTYNAFLQTMSKTAGKVGSTVAELTNMAADWARLGYSLKEAGMLAESTAILLNVSEFTDANAASEALISTMQAFEYTAKDSQHVVDILNEVGKLIAPR